MAEADEQAFFNPPDIESDDGDDEIVVVSDKSNLKNRGISKAPPPSPRSDRITRADASVAGKKRGKGATSVDSSSSTASVIPSKRVNWKDPSSDSVLVSLDQELMELQQQTLSYKKKADPRKRGPEPSSAVAPVSARPAKLLRKTDSFTQQIENVSTTVF
jgi:hypothetical protein